MNLAVRVALGMVALVAATLAAVDLLVFSNLRKLLLPLELARLESHTNLLAAELERHLAGVRADLLVLSDLAGAEGFVRAQSAGGIDAEGAATEAQWWTALNQSLASVATHNPPYVLLRVIGGPDNRSELMRVERSGPAAAVRIVPEDELRSEGVQASFSETMQLGDGEVFVSPIELNRVSGVVEVPHRPVLRVATPLLARDGTAVGLLTINVDLTLVLARVSAAAFPGGQIFLVNADGDFLVHPDPAMVFGFDLGARHRIQDTYPYLAETINWEADVVNVVSLDRDRELGVAVRHLRPAGGDPIALIEVLPEEQLLATARSIRRVTLSVGLGAVLFAIVAAALLARSLTRSLTLMTKAVEGMNAGAGPAAPVAAGGELGMLARAFETMRRDVHDKTVALKREVVERREAELEAERNAANARVLTAIVESTEDAIIARDLEGNITSWNRAAEQLFGYRAAEVIGRSVSAIVPPTRREEEAQILRRVKRGDSVRHFDTVRVAKSGRMIRCSLTISPLRSASGEIVGASDITRDITEMKRAEEMFRLAVESAPSGMVLVDRRGTIALVNAETERLFGFKRSELIGRPVEVLVPERFRGAHLGYLLEYTKNPEARPMGAGRELFGLRKDGTEFPVEIGLNPVESYEGVHVIAAITDISARKQVDVALRESKERYEAIIDTALDGVVVMDHEGRLVGMNAAAERIFGHREEAVMGKLLADVMIPPALREQHRQGLEHYLATGEGPVLGRRIEVPGLRADGTEMPLELSICRMPGSGDPLFTAFMRDITERKHAEEKFHLAVESSPSGMVLVDHLGKITLVNAETERLFGYERSELIGGPVDRLVPERSREGHPGYLHDFTRNPVARPMGAGRDLYGRRKDGTEFPVEIGLNPVESPEGLFVIASITDISTRKKAEAALRESEQRFREIAESLPQLVWTCLADGTCDYLSRQWLEYTGRPEEEQLGSGWLEQIHPDDRDQVMRDWTASRAEGAALQTVFRIRSGEGDYRWFDTRAVPLRDQAGNIVKWFGSNTDITEQRQAAEALERQAEDLRRSNEELGQFAYVASHDLQEPLRMVASYTELLGERYRGRLDEKADKFIFYAVDGARRMQRLVNDLLAFSRVGRSTLRIEKVDTGALVARVLSLMQGRIADAGATVTCGPLPVLPGDELQLGQVFQNLIGNALKFRSEVRPEVRIDAKRADGGWQFSVRDNGIGIEMSEADRLFQMFQRLHERGKYEGSGIGLAIVKKIVENHGGRVWFESTPGSGSVFHFTIPSAGKAMPA